MSKIDTRLKLANNQICFSKFNLSKPDQKEASMTKQLKIDQSKLLGFKILSKQTVLSSADAGAKMGGKIGTKPTVLRESTKPLVNA